MTPIIFVIAIIANALVLNAVLKYPFNRAPRPPGPIFADVVYNKPYCRITPYLVGMALGYVLYKYPRKSLRIHWVSRLIQRAHGSHHRVIILINKRKQSLFSAAEKKFAI